MKRSIRRWLVLGSCTLVVAAAAAAVGLAWYLREHRDTYFTDADTIHRPVETATPRDILWRPPVVLPPVINTAGNEHGPVMSPDGSTFYFVAGQAGQGTDIYACAKTPTGWSGPRALSAINTEADELDPAPSADGRALYFTSNRPGGLGDYDLWVARRAGSGWSAPVNLGAGVNTRYDETGPSPTPDGGLLYFASNRPRPVLPDGADEAGEDVGGWEGAARDDPRAVDFDLYTVRIDGAGHVAVTVEALNSSSDETAAAVSPAGDFVYFASDRPGGVGGFDLYRARRLEGRYTAPRNLGPPVSTPGNELDPAVSLEGFGLHYAGDADGAAGYDLLYTTSREVFTRSDAYRATLDWAALWAMIWPYLLATLIAAAILLALIRALTRLQYRRLTLLAKCVLVSLMVHMILMLTFAFWSVSTAIAQQLEPGSGMKVVLTSPSIGAGLAAQIRGELTSVEVDAAVPDQAEAQQQDSVATLPPSAVPAPQARPSEVAPSRIETPEAPSVADASREAPLESAALPKPDLAAAARPLEPEPLAMALPSETARSARAEAVMSVPVAAPRASEARRVSAEALSSAPAPSSAVTLVPAATDPLSNPSASESLVDAAAQRGAPQRLSTAVIETKQAPGRTTDLNLPPMPSAPTAQREAQLAEARLDAGAVGGPVQPARAADVALPVESASGQAVPRIEVTTLAAAVDVAPEPLAAMPGSDAPSVRSAPLPERAAAAVPATAVPFDLPALEETVAVARSSPTREADLSVGPDVATPPAPRANWAFAPDRTGPPAAVGLTGLLPASRALDLSGETAVATLADASAREAPSAVAAPLETAAAAETDPAPLSLDLPRLENAPAGSAPEATQELALVAPTSKRAVSVPQFPDAQPRANVRVPGVALPPAEVPPPRSAVVLDRPDVKMSMPDIADPELPMLARVDLELALPTEAAPPNPYAQRAPEQREELLQEMGGSAETERAVAMALDWLARHQSRDGRWDGDDFDDRCGRCSGKQRVKCDIALTGLSVLCFTAADHTHTTDGPYRQVVARAVGWLLDQQTDDGALMRDEALYSHGIATIALSEAYGMTGDPRLKSPVQAAVDFIYEARNTRVGGWRYRPGQMGDTSVLGWQVMALTSAKRAQIEVPQDAFAVAGNWLDLVSRPSRPGQYAYQPQRQVTPAMTAEGMFVRQLLGADRTDSRMRASAAYVLRYPPRWEPHANTYYWYYATLALFHHQGRPWAEWNEAVKAVLLENQRVAGRAAGSWDPQGQWAEVAGRVYQTAMATLTLEVYYRYLPSFVDAPTP